MSNFQILADGRVRIPFTFAHGQLEKRLKSDLFAISDANFSPVLGALSCTFEGEECTLFFWQAKTIKIRHGLAVLNADKTAYNYAKELFEEKSDFF